MAVAADPSSVKVINEGLGLCTIGNRDGGFAWKAPALPPGATFVSAKSMSDPARVTAGYKQLVARPGGRDEGAGRGKKPVASAVQQVRVVAAATPPPLNRAPYSSAEPESPAHELADALYDQRDGIPGHDHRDALVTDYPALDGASRAAYRLISDHLHPEVAARLLALHAARAEGASPLVLNAKVSELVALGWPLLKREDFRPAQPPLTAHIYLVAFTMAAEDWVREAERLLDAGERPSKASGETAPIGFRIAIHSARELAELAIKEGKRDTPITAVYVGQEHRSVVKNLFKRPWEHGTTRGSPNAAEILFVTKRSDTGRACDVLGAVTWVRRLVAILPHGDATLVNRAEAFVMAALWGKGFVALNDSPTGLPRGQRFLAESWDGHPAKVVEQMEDYLAEHGDAAKNKRVEEHPSPWVRRALLGMRYMLEKGHYVDVHGEPMKPTGEAAKAPARTRKPGAAASAVEYFYSIRDCYYALVSDGALGGEASKEYHCALWCGACDCQSREFICKHLHILRAAASGGH